MIVYKHFHKTFFYRVDYDKQQTIVVRQNEIYSTDKILNGFNDDDMIICTEQQFKKAFSATVKNLKSKMI